MKLRVLPSVTIVSLLCMAAAAAAQDVLVQAKTLYTAAAYDEALKLLEAAGGDVSQPEVKQYRALCLLALGRTADAEREVAAVVEADPLYMPDGEEVPPRVVTMFTDIRRKLLPAMIRSSFADAKRVFQEGNRDRARQEFEQVVRLLDDPVVSSNADLADLKMVASGFVDLARSSPAPASVRPAPPLGPGPTVATTAVATSAPKAAVSVRAETPAAAPAPTPAPSRPEPSSSVGTVLAPVAIQQVLPTWRPRDWTAPSRELVGSIRVQIDETGQVTSAKMERSVHPEYDRLVLAAAEHWQYRPATRDGVQITSEKVIEIRVRPRAN